jgi:hypothetical protein
LFFITVLPIFLPILLACCAEAIGSIIKKAERVLNRLIMSTVNDSCVEAVGVSKDNKKKKLQLNIYASEKDIRKLRSSGFYRSGVSCSAGSAGAGSQPPPKKSKKKDTKNGSEGTSEETSTEEDVDDEDEDQLEAPVELTLILSEEGATHQAPRGLSIFAMMP